MDAILRNDLGVGQNYEHTPKRVTSGQSIETNGAVLKWYKLAPQDRQVPDEIDRLARSFLGRQTNLEAKGLGFVILHRCGEGFYFLIVNTWRGNNEVWETLFYKDGDAMPISPSGRATECISRPSACGNSRPSGRNQNRGRSF